MYSLGIVVCDIGEEKLRRRIQACDGLRVAERCAYLNAAFTEGWQMHGFDVGQSIFLERLGQDPHRDQVVLEATKKRFQIIDPMALDVFGSFALSFGRGNENIERFLETMLTLTWETIRQPGEQRLRYEDGGMSSALNSTLTFGSERYLNTRWRLRQFVEWSKTNAARAHHSYVDVDSEIAAVFEMPYEDLIAAIEALGALNDIDDMSRRRTASFTIDDVSQWDSEGRIQHLLRRVSVTRDAFAASIGAIPLHDLRNALIAILLSTPIIEMGGRFITPSQRMLDNLASMGWVYALADARRLVSDKSSQAFWIFFGAFYESYIAGIFERIGRRSGFEFWAEQEVNGTRTSDALFRRDREVFFIEVVSGRPSAALLRQPGNEDEIARNLKRLVFEKLSQLATNIRRYRSGEFEGFGFAHNPDDAIYPVLVQYKAFLRTPEFNDEVQRRFFAELDGVNGVREVEFLDAEVLEGLEQYLSAGVSLSALIEQKLAEPGLRSELFKNYLSSRQPEIELRFAAEIQDADRRWQQRISERVSAWQKPNAAQQAR
jgi:hypothetical protein